KILKKDFKILKLTSDPDKEISVYLESVNYMMYEFSEDHNDKRQLFTYIIVPNDVDWDFTTITLKEFINFLAQNKSKTIEMIDTKNIQYINNDFVENIEIITEIKKDDLDPFWL
ncbi:hypothetical protein M0Q97_12515, partial [Candidatus Dojkabacteria bacterium]|nr:hypothetical protein [Candidatus Dojkabacteria bacterium]